MPTMITFDSTYAARTPLSTIGSSNGIFLDACIRNRITARLVLGHRVSILPRTATGSPWPTLAHVHLRVEPKHDWSWPWHDED